MKKIITFLMCSTLSFSCFADCAEAPPTSDPTFCPTFKAIAKCHCLADSGNTIPEKQCEDMNIVYSRMVATFGSQERACQWQEKSGSEIRVKYQICMDDWNYYRAYCK